MTTNQVKAIPDQSTDSLARVTSQHAKFLGFLSTRVEDKAAAEDILQSAYLKAMEHSSEIREAESTVAWFYRILRNAITDHYRRSGARSRAYEAFTVEAPMSYEPQRIRFVPV